MGKFRCDAVVVSIIATEYDEHGRPIDEISGAAKKVFRATARDFWSEVDKAVAELEKQRRAPAPALPGATPAAGQGKKRR